MGSRRARILWVKVLVVWGLGLAMAGPAAAAGAGATDDGCLQEPTCSGHYQKALSLYEAGRYETALPEFQAAYESRQMPWLLINIGRTLHRLGRLDEAITLYNRYEQAVPNGDPETLKKVREYKAQAQVLLSAKSTTATPTATSASSPPGITPVPVDQGSAPATTPIYKKWWFWTAIGGGVAIIVVAGIAIGVSNNQTSAPPPPEPLPPLYPTGTTVYHPMF